MTSFSERHGLTTDIPIQTREAPSALRSTIVDLAYSAGLKPSELRKIVCKVLFETPDPNNWSERPNIDDEVRRLLEDAQWNDVYDVIENVAVAVNGTQHALFPTRSKEYREFESELNRLFRRRGIGWQLRDFLIEYRGDEGVAAALDAAPRLLVETGRQTAATVLHEALKDLARRPSAEVTGAVQHAMAALECVARDKGATKETLGELIRRGRVQLPPPLDQAVAMIWGFASNNGRHLTEGRPPTFAEAELIVGLCAVLSMYLARKP